MSEPSSLKDVAAGRPESREAKLKNGRGGSAPRPPTPPLEPELGESSRSSAGWGVLQVGCGADRCLRMSRHRAAGLPGTATSLHADDNYSKWLPWPAHSVCPCSQGGGGAGCPWGHVCRLVTCVFTQAHMRLTQRLLFRSAGHPEASAPL